MSTKEDIEEIGRKTLADMIRRRDLLSSGIAQLEYSLANPPKPIDWDKVMACVNEEMAKSKQIEERHYKELLRKEKEGTLDTGEQILIKLYRDRKLCSSRNLSGEEMS